MVVRVKNWVFFQNRLTSLISFRMRLRWWICLKSLKTINSKIFLKQFLAFLRERSWKFSGALNLAIFFRECVSNCLNAEETLKRSKLGISDEKRWFLFKKTFSFLKIGKRRIFFPACAPCSKTAQEIWKRSRNWYFWGM